MDSALEVEEKGNPGPGYFRISGMLLAAFIGGLWAGAFLLYRNYQAQGELGKARATAMLAVPLQIASWAISFMGPPDILSRLMLFLPQIALAAILLDRFYRPWITAREASGAPAISNRSVLKVGVFFFLADRLVAGSVHDLFMWVLSGGL